MQCGWTICSYNFYYTYIHNYKYYAYFTGNITYDAFVNTYTNNCVVIIEYNGLRIHEMQVHTCTLYFSIVTFILSCVLSKPYCLNCEISEYVS